MGSTPGPDTGTFELGQDCDLCQTGSHPIFIPGFTPKYVKLQVYENGTVIDEKILLQDLPTECRWEYVSPLPKWYRWWNILGPVDRTHCRIWWFEAAVLKRSFNYLDAPPCLTSIPNNEVSPEKSGDRAQITWGEEIDEAAYLAQ